MHRDDASAEPPVVSQQAATLAELDEIDQRLDDYGDDLPREVADDIVRRLRRMLDEMR
jgi:hypothetical protein